MTLVRGVLCVAAAALLTGAADRRAPVGRVTAAEAGPAAADGEPAPRLPAFTLFGWIAPPLAFTSAERYAEIAAAGLNVVHRAWDDSFRLADNRARFAAARPSGLECMAIDGRFDAVDAPGVDSEALLDSIVADYRDEPAFLAYLFADEPEESEFARLARWHRALRARDPEHPAFNNLRGRGAFPTRDGFRAHLETYLDSTGAPQLCADHYDFLVDGDNGLYVEHLAVLHSVARARTGGRWWTIVQLVPHGPFRALTHGEVRWQVAMALAYGARGIGYFTYWTPPPDPAWDWRPAVIDWDGTPTPWHAFLAGWNPRVRAAGDTLARATWLSTRHAGSVPRGGTGFAPDSWVRAVEGRAALGAFAEADGRLLLLVANADSASARRVTLTLSARGVERLADGGRWEALVTEPAADDHRLPLDLDAGDFALLRLAPAWGYHVAGEPPGLRVAPNPARGAVGFTLERVSSGARLEVLDAAGRRVWARRIVPGASMSVTWRGERERGGRAPAGLYLVRVEDARGVAVRRVSWLGAP